MSNAPDPVTCRLRDGRTIVIRALGAADRARRPPGLDALAARPPAERMGTAWTHFAEAELSYLAHVDHANHIALIALSARGDCAEMGVARCVRLAPRAPVAEVSVTVLPSFRRAGAGGRLLGRLAQVASRRGISRFHAVFNADDEAVEAMLRRINARIDAASQRQKYAEIDAIAVGEMWSRSFAPLARLASES